jgi:hypothetical protein
VLFRDDRFATIVIPEFRRWAPPNLEECGPIAGGIRDARYFEKHFQQLRTAAEMALGLHFLCTSLATDTG